MGRLEACARPDRADGWETGRGFSQCLLVPLEGDRTRTVQLKTFQSKLPFFIFMCRRPRGSHFRLWP